MQQELIQKIHNQKYQNQLSLDDYIGQVALGLQLITTSGLNCKNSSENKAVNLALEYNMELMVNYLSI